MCMVAVLRFFPHRLPQGNMFVIAACRKEARAKASFPLQLTGPYRLEGTTLLI